MTKYQYYFFDLDGIGVLFGFGDRKELEAAGADYIVNTPEEIMDI